MPCDLSGKVALITGASSGIGTETAKHFAELGAHLALAGRNEANLTAVVNECSKKTKAIAVIGDLSKEDDIKRTVDETIKHFGKLDILVNNAGIIQFGSIETTSLQQYDEIMNVNVRSVFRLSNLAVPYLIKQKGCIVNVSSICGTRAFEGVMVYCMSKSAVDQMTKCMALDLASKGVRVNAVNPGVIKTELQKRGGLNDDSYAQFLERSKETHPLGRIGDAIEVARSIAFLASDDSSFVTGELLHVDGGRHAVCPR